MKLKIFTLFLCAMFTGVLFAQERPTYDVAKVDVAPTVDGEIDEMWEAQPANNIDKNFQSELPTLGASGETYWKMVWVENDGIYILLVVNDDEFFPNYEVDPVGNSWEYDKPEVYFDCNYLLQDGGGASGEGQPGNGHHQCAPSFEADKIDGSLLDAGTDGEASANDAGVKYAYLVNDPDYVAEFFFPMAYLTDEDGIANDLSGEVGFDITVIDRDTGDGARKRAVWANTGVGGAANESWNSMDDCGILTFQGVGDKTFVESINLTASDITMNNKKMQVTAEVLPENATTKTVGWSIENGTGRARISNDGVVTPISDGTVTIIAEAKDGSYVTAQQEITISGQLVSLPELSMIRNGFFDQVSATGTAMEWSGNYMVVDGAMYLPAPDAQRTNWWDASLSNQTGFGANETDEYQFSFVLWSEAPDTFYCDFEDPANGYNRYGTSTHEFASGLSDGSEDGQSQWEFVTTMEPTKYVFDVVFNEKVANTTEALNLMGGKHEQGGIYIDSIILVNINDLDMVSVYNPVGTITVTGAEGATVVDVAGTLQMSADVQPAEADYKDVYWSVEPGTGEATIDEAGLLTGVTDGTVTVVALASDDSNVKGTLVVTVGTVGVEKNRAATLKVYPNPAVSELVVEVASEDATVTIYNSVGMKMEEAVVSGTVHRFNVSGYASGLYFVKTGNEVVKFVK